MSDLPSPDPNFYEVDQVLFCTLDVVFMVIVLIADNKLLGDKYQQINRSTKKILFGFYAVSFLQIVSSVVMLALTYLNRDNKKVQ